MMSTVLKFVEEIIVEVVFKRNAAGFNIKIANSELRMYLSFFS